MVLGKNWLFCNQDHNQTLFLVVFSGRTNKEKFKFPYKNDGFTPLAKWDFSDIKNCFVYSLRSHFSIYSIIKHYSWSYFHQKQIKKNLNQNHGLTPLEKYNFLYLKNCCFRSLKFLYIFITSLNTIPRRSLGLFHCGPRFARHIASV